MSMTDRTCVICHSGYTYYQVKNNVPDCPKCGALGGYFKRPNKTKKIDYMDCSECKKDYLTCESCS